MSSDSDTAMSLSVPPADEGSSASTPAVPEERRFAPAVLQWRGVTLDVPATKRSKARRLLDDVSGVALPGTITAVLGASGSGKSTLLNVLGYRVRDQHAGTITLNGRPIGSHMLRSSAYVTQDTHFLDTLTVRETLRFAAKLRLPGTVSSAEQAARVEALIDLLDLRACADSYVGKPDTPPCISGGERRRLMLANALIFRPSLLLADEITSALDSASAHRITLILRRLAAEGMTIVLTLHQPRASLLAMCDNVMLLAAGKVVYYGPGLPAGAGGGGVVGERAGQEGDDASSGSSHNLLSYFDSVGYTFSPWDNPADSLLDLVNAEGDFRHVSATVSVKPRQGEDGAVPPGMAAPREEVIAYLVDCYRRSDLKAWAERDVTAVAGLAAEEQGTKLDGAPTSSDAPPACCCAALVCRRRAARTVRRFPTSWCTQFGVVSKRAFLYKLRAPDAVASQFFSSIVLAVIVGSIFFHLPLTPNGVRDRFAAVSFIVLTQSFMSYDQVVLIPHERNVLLQESSAGLYPTSAFYLGRTSAEVPVQLGFGALVGLITYYMFGLRTDESGAPGFYILVMALVTHTGAAWLLLAGALSKTMAGGSALATLILVFGSLFNGFFVTPENLPAVYRWIETISFPAWGVKSAVVQELRGLEIPCAADPVSAAAAGYNATAGYPPGCTLPTGDDMLAQVGFAGTDIWLLCLWQLIQALVVRVLGYFALHFLYTGQPAKARLRALLEAP